MKKTFLKILVTNVCLASASMLLWAVVVTAVVDVPKLVDKHPQSVLIVVIVPPAMLAFSVLVTIVEYYANK